MAAALFLSSSASAGVEELGSCNSLDRVEERPSGQIVGVGTTRDCGDSDSPGKVAVIQLDAQGELDPAFGDGGVVILSTAVDQRETELALQPSGRVVVDTEAGLVGLTTAGKLDPAFGTNGLVTTDFGVSPAPYSSTPLEMDMNSDGSLVVFGSYQEVEEYTDLELVLAKYNADGQPDPDFGDLGVSNIDRGVADLKIGPDGKIYTTGTDNLDGVTAPSVTRFGADGDLDTTYGPASNGTAVADPGFGPTSFGIADYLVVEPSGSTILSGSMIGSTFGTFIRKLDPDGLPLPMPGEPRLMTDVAPDGNLISIKGPLILDVANPEEFDISEQTPDFQAVSSTSLPLVNGNTLARDAQVGPSGNLFGAGRMDGCFNGCPKAMMIMKAGSSPAGFDPDFGNDAGVATIPEISCSVLMGTTIADERCHRTLDGFPSRAKVSLGRKSKSAILLKASLPDGSRTSGEAEDREVTVALPSALKLRGKRPAVRVKVSGRLIKGAKVKVTRTKIEMDLSDVNWNSAKHPLELKVAKKSLKPLKKRHKTRKLKFKQSVFYEFEDTSTETVSTTIVSKPVLKPKRRR